jgi:LacI family transcriptional regulator
MATIKDIADKTGVSITTVSRVLNQDKSFNVADQTRLNILKVAEELNYKVKQKKVQQEQSIKIGLVYWYTTVEELNDPYYLAIRLSIENECKDKSIELEYIHVNQTNLSSIESIKVDGIIALGKYSQTIIEKLYLNNENLVVVDSWNKFYNIDVVISDLDTATKDIIDFFFQRNIQKIGFICGVEKTFDGEEIIDPRLIAYRNEMFARKAFDPKQVELGHFSADSGYEIMMNLIKEKQLLSAYIVGSDAMAIGCLKALNENKIKVPEEVAIFSYDNTPFSQFMIPSLSTVETNTQLMGESSVTLLLERLMTGRTVGKKLIIPTQLIVRDSV